MTTTVKLPAAPVGKCDCPIKQCAEVVDVFKYRGDSTDGKRRRFAGRLFCTCPKHGRTENQEYLQEHITWAESEKTQAAAAAAVHEKKPAAPKPAARSTPAAPRSSSPPRPSTERETPLTGAAETLSRWLQHYNGIK